MQKREKLCTSLLPGVGRPPAHQEATLSVTRRSDFRRDAEQEGKTKKRYTASDMARRLSTGRAPELLLCLMDTRVFSLAVQSAWAASGQPQRGLQADLPLKGRVTSQVTILDIFTSWCSNGRCFSIAWASRAAGGICLESDF